MQPVSRAHLDPLVDMGEHLRASLVGWQDTAPAEGRSRRPSDLFFDLTHLAHHDGDGFLVATVDDTVAGFCTAFVRSRTLSVTGLWIVPEFADGVVATHLVRRALAYGDRAGTTEACSLVLGGAAAEAVFFRFGLRPRFPVYRIRLPRSVAQTFGHGVARLLRGSVIREQDLRRQTGRADTERIDRLCRGVARPMDHEYWVTQRGLKLALVQDGNRVAGYAYGGGGRCGPVAATTSDAALAALGWALQLACDDAEDTVELLVPAVFEVAVEHLLEAGGNLFATAQWMSRSGALGMERYLLGTITLP